MRVCWSASSSTTRRRVGPLPRMCAPSSRYGWLRQGSQDQLVTVPHSHQLVQGCQRPCQLHEHDAMAARRHGWWRAAISHASCIRNSNIRNSNLLFRMQLACDMAARHRCCFVCNVVRVRSAAGAHTMRAPDLTRTPPDTAAFAHAHVPRRTTRSAPKLSATAS